MNNLKSDSFLYAPGISVSIRVPTDKPPVPIERLIAILHKVASENPHAKVQFYIEILD